MRMARKPKVKAKAVDMAAVVAHQAELVATENPMVELNGTALDVARMARALERIAGALERSADRIIMSVVAAPPKTEPSGPEKPKLEAPKVEAPKGATLEDARRAVLKFAQARGADLAKTLLGEKFKVARVSDLAGEGVFAEVVRVFAAALERA